MADEKFTPGPVASAAPPSKKGPAGHQISIIGKGSHKIGGKNLKKGQTYKMDSLGLKGTDLKALHEDPHVVVEPIDKDGKVIVPGPGDSFDDEDGGL